MDMNIKVGWREAILALSALATLITGGTLAASYLAPDFRADPTTPAFRWYAGRIFGTSLLIDLLIIGSSWRRWHREAAARRQAGLASAGARSAPSPRTQLLVAIGVGLAVVSLLASNRGKGVAAGAIDGAIIGLTIGAIIGGVRFVMHRDRSRK